MDHLDQRIPNIVASKDNQRSLFGSVSYFLQGAAIGKPEVDIYLVTQHAEPARPNEMMGNVQIPKEIRVPIGNFVLSAAGEMLDLDAAILTLGAMMMRTNEGLEKSIRVQVAAKANELGVPESKLLGHYGARFKFMLAAKIDNKNKGQARPDS